MDYNHPKMDDYYIRNKNHPNMDGFLLTIFIHFWILTIPATLLASSNKLGLFS